MSDQSPPVSDSTLTDSAPPAPIDGRQMILDAVAAANQPEPTEEPPAAPPPAEPSGGHRLYAGKYKSVDALVSAHEELQRTWHADRGEMAEMRRQVEALQASLQPQQQEPQQFQRAIPFGWQEPETVEELEQLAQEYPDRTAMWAMENAQRLDPALVQGVVNYWYQVNPAQANAYQIQQMMASFLPTIQQQVAPLQEARQETLMSSAIDRVEQSIGTDQFLAYRDRMVEFIEANPQTLPESAYSDPNQMAEMLSRVYAMLYGQDLIAGKVSISQEPAAPATPPPPAPHLTRAVSQTTTAGTGSSNGQSVGSEEEQAIAAIQQAILAGGR